MLMNEEEFSSCRSVSEVVNELLLSDACVIHVIITKCCAKLNFSASFCYI